MRRVQKISVSPEQIEILKSYYEQGLKPTAIARLNLESLAGLNLGNIQRIMRLNGLFDRAISERLKRSVRLPPERKAEIQAYIRENPHLPDSRLAVAMHISFAMAKKLRRACLGVIQGRKRMLPEIEDLRVKRLKYSHAIRRMLRYIEYLRQRTALNGAGNPMAKKKCKVCRERWPETKFFFETSKGSNGKTYYYDTCRICFNEFDAMRRAGMSRSGIERWTQKGFWVPASKAMNELQNSDKAIPLPHRHAATNEFDRIRCLTCGASWIFTDQFFQKVGEHVIQVCLACPRRKFFRLS